MTKQRKFLYFASATLLILVLVLSVAAERSDRCPPLSFVVETGEKQEEIALSKKQNERQLILEFRAGNAVFLLGYRAKGFIEKDFLGTLRQKNSR